MRPTIEEGLLDYCDQACAIASAERSEVPEDVQSVHANETEDCAVEDWTVRSTSSDQPEDDHNKYDELSYNAPHCNDSGVQETRGGIECHEATVAGKDDGANLSGAGLRCGRVTKFVKHQKCDQTDERHEVGRDAWSSTMAGRQVRNAGAKERDTPVHVDGHTKSREAQTRSGGHMR